MKTTLIFISIMLLSGLSALYAQSNTISPQTQASLSADEPSVYDSRRVTLNGPRFGFTYLTADTQLVQLKKFAGTDDIKPVFTQIGWQFETRYFELANGTQGVLELIPLIGGLDQGLFIPNMTGIIGVRGGNGFEFGVGPNVSPAGPAMTMAIGYTIKSDGIYFPINFAATSSSTGYRFNVLVGFNARARNQKR